MPVVEGRKHLELFPHAGGWRQASATGLSWADARQPAWLGSRHERL